MKARAGIGIAAGALLALSSLAHAFLGWPALRPALQAAQVDERLIGALAVGWYFGSVAMLVFGVIVLQAALRAARGHQVETAPVRAIAVAYVLFGLTAFVCRGLNPHFLFFVACGALVAVFGYWKRR